MGLHLLGDIFTQMIQKMIVHMIEQFGLDIATQWLVHYAPNPFGFLASGGVAAAGKPYIVGEKGPELMVPGETGTVIPNHILSGGVTSSAPYELSTSFSSTAAAMSSSGDTNISGGSHTFHIHESGNARETAREVARYLKGTTPRFSPANS
jgi:hypothetical protein